MDRSCLAAYVAAVTVLVLVAAIIVRSAIFACRPPPPKRIYQTLFTSHKPPFEELPACLKKNLETMRDMNPDLTFVYFSDADVDAWMRANASASEIRAFDQLNVGAARADLFGRRPELGAQIQAKHALWPVAAWRHPAGQLAHAAAQRASERLSERRPARPPLDGHFVGPTTDVMTDVSTL